MSKYEELKTVLSEERFPVEALQDLGYAPEVCPEGAALFGYTPCRFPFRTWSRSAPISCAS